MNKIHIIGNVTRDPMSRTTQEGKQVCHFTVAVNRRSNTADGQQSADFFDVATFSALADNCARYIRKGKKVAVVGPVSASVYKAQNGDYRAQLQIVATEVEFLTPFDQAPQNAPQAPKTDKQTGFVQEDDADMPF